MLSFLALVAIFIYKELFPKKEVGIPKMKNIPEPPKENHVIKYDKTVQDFASSVNDHANKAFAIKIISELSKGKQISGSISEYIVSESEILRTYLEVNQKSNPKG